MHLLHQRCDAGDVRSLQHAITRDVRIDDCCYLSRGHTLCKSDRLDLRDGLPAACCNLPIAAINTYTYLSWKTLCRSNQGIPLLQRRRAEHDSMYSGFQGTTDSVQIAHSPP